MRITHALQMDPEAVYSLRTHKAEKMQGYHSYVTRAGLILGAIGLFVLGWAEREAHAQQAAGRCAQLETHWRSIETSTALAAYQDHLARFPNCPSAVRAKA